MSRRGGAVAATTALTLALTGCLPEFSQLDIGLASADDPSLEAFHGQQVDWSECEEFYLEGLDCATVQVPLDYAAPGGERIEVGLSRRSADEADQREGVLFTNPGGPGSTGRFTATEIGQTPLGSAYDVIGMDPRGVGTSTRLDCGAEPPEPSTRPTDEEIEQHLEGMRDYARACEEAEGDRLGHFTTANTARDMDIVRAVLGEEQINYLGASYGTYLGAVYGTLFPERLDRAVLDSAVDPDRIWRGNLLVQAPAETANVERFTSWLAEHEGVFGLGDSPEQIVQAFEETAERLREQPREGEDGRTYDEEFFRHVVVSSARDQADWEESGLLLRALVEGAPLPQDPDSPEQPEGPDGPEEPGDPQGPEGSEDPDEIEELLELLEGSPHLMAVIQCEGPWHTDLDEYRSDMREYAQAHPFGSGAAVAGPEMCAFSEELPAEPAVDLTREWQTPALVIAGEFDANTSYEAGAAMAERLDSPLVSVLDEGGHVFYSPAGRSSEEGTGYPCVAEAVESYLLEGQEPQEQDCHDRPRPEVGDEAA